MINYNGKVFKKVLGYDGYYASYDGQILSTKKKEYKILTSRFMGCVKYPIVQLWVNNKGKNVPLHKLVALAWIPIPKGYTLKQAVNAFRNRDILADHIDGDKLHYSADNLRWLTGYENSNAGNFEKTKPGLNGNQNAKGTKNKPSTYKRYNYYYNGKEYTDINALCDDLDCSKSCITEAFRRTLGLVKQGKLTRKEVQKQKK